MDYRSSPSEMNLLKIGNLDAHFVNLRDSCTLPQYSCSGVAIETTSFYFYDTK